MIPEANRRFVQGAISKVYNIDNLLSSEIDLNLTAIEFNGTVNTNINNPLVETVTRITNDIEVGVSGTFRGTVASMVR